MVAKNISESDEAPSLASDLAVRLSRNMTARRHALGLTQAQVAERLCLDTETVSRFERGKHLPSLVTLERLSTFCSRPSETCWQKCRKWPMTMHSRLRRGLRRWSRAIESSLADCSKSVATTWRDGAHINTEWSPLCLHDCHFDGGCRGRLHLEVATRLDSSVKMSSP